MKKPIKVRVVRKKPSEVTKTSSGPAYVPSAVPKSSTPAPAPPYVPVGVAKANGAKKLKVKVPDERRASVIRNRGKIMEDIGKSVFGRLEKLDLDDSIAKALGLQNITGEIYDAILENRYEEFLAGVTGTFSKLLSTLGHMRIQAEDNGGYIVRGSDYLTIAQIDHALDSVRTYESRAKNKYKIKEIK